MASVRKIVVFGGNGYVGQRIVSNLLRKQTNVVSISRSGRPLNMKNDDNAMVKWLKADVFDVPAWRGELEGAEAVVSCIGAFGSNEFMEKINGDANILLASEALKVTDIKRFVYLSTVENNLPDFVLKGYFNGKKRAEDAIMDAFQNNAWVIRPGFMYGTRDVPFNLRPSSSKSSTESSGGVLSIPLWLLGRPLEAILSIPGMEKLRDNLPGMKAILARPLSVDCVASVAAAAACGELDSSIQKDAANGSAGHKLDVKEILRAFRH